MNNIELLGHSGIKLKGEKNIYIDPYKLEKWTNDADYIFITHSHYDHFSPDDILKLKNNDTTIIVPLDLKDEASKLEVKNILVVEPNNNYEIGEITFSTVVSYNILKAFHPKKNKWVGYIIKLNNTNYYIAGDTDFTNELKNIKCDVAFVPVGGTYTMDYVEAGELINTIKPKLAIPIHYGSIVGTREDAIKFKELIKKDIECEVIL